MIKILQTVFDCAVHHCVVHEVLCGIGHQELGWLIIVNCVCVCVCVCVCADC